MHFGRRWCHCWKQSWKTFSGIPRTVTLSRCVAYKERQHISVPSGHFIISERSKNRRGLRSGEWGGRSIFVIGFLARNYRTLNASCSGALSYSRIHLSSQSSGLFLRTDSRYLSALQYNTVDSPFVLVKRMHSELSPCDLELRARHACFSRLRWILCFILHALASCFWVVLTTPRFNIGNDPIKHLCIV
jgi:hypothetical protein